MKKSGIMMPIFSLKSRYGIGTLGKEAYKFADFLSASKVKIWQMLPLGPTGYGDSPYQCLSSFAGNTYFIDPDFLVRDHYMKKSDLPEIKHDERIDYGHIYFSRKEMLRKAYDYSYSKISGKVKAFGKKNPDVYDYAVFMALKDKYNGTPWYSFPLDIRLREKEALEKVEKELADDIHFHLYCQYLFFEQWDSLKKYIHSKKIEIMGDLPIYVAPDSSDAWANRSAFQLNSEGQQEFCAAVPPDYFSETGQKWGNPLYDWESMRQNDFEFVIRRMTFVSKMFDILRLDHFIGYANYYSVQNDAVDAKIGSWRDGPGIQLFETAHRKLPHTKFVAEDLGIMSDKVLTLMKQTGFPCMRVIQFAFSGEEDNMHLPQVISHNTLYYTSTHDNDTSKAFWSFQPEEYRDIIGRFIHLDRRQPVDSLIRAVYASIADYAVIPIADWLGAGVEGKINSPGTSEGNWGARYSGYTSKKLAEKIKKFNKEYGR